MAGTPGQIHAPQHNNLPADGSSPEKVPADIADNTHKLELWRFIVSDLRDRNLWSPTYTILVEQMVHCAARLREVMVIINDEGLTVPRYTSKGEMIPGASVKHPLLSEEAALRDKLLKFLEKLGSSPRDIVFLTQTESVPSVVEVVSTDKAKIQYFRD